MDSGRLERLLGSPVVRATPLGGGCIAQVLRVDLADGQVVVVKDGKPGDRLDVEGWMLRLLAERCPALPLPGVHVAEDALLVMDALDASGNLTPAAEEHAAEVIAGLHAVTAHRFGLERDTVIGGLPQPNPWTERWSDFFRDHRLLAMARQGLEAGRLPAGMMTRIERLAGRLDTWIDDGAPPSLLHGDLWTGNVLVGMDGHISGLIDPAVYYGDAEIELAFTTLFGTFGEPFFRRYDEIRPLRPGFFEVRRDLYLLYPLLVHVRLFGGSYVGSVDRILTRLGC